MQNRRKLCVSESRDSYSSLQTLMPKNTYMLKYSIPLKHSIPKLHIDDNNSDSHVFQVKLLQFKLCVFRRNKAKVIWI